MVLWIAFSKSLSLLRLIVRLLGKFGGMEFIGCLVCHCGLWFDWGVSLGRLFALSLSGWVVFLFLVLVLGTLFLSFSTVLIKSMTVVILSPNTLQISRTFCNLLA